MCFSPAAKGLRGPPGRVTRIRSSTAAARLAGAERLTAGIGGKGVCGPIGRTERAWPRPSRAGTGGLEGVDQTTFIGGRHRVI